MRMSPAAGMGLALGVGVAEDGAALTEGELPEARWPVPPQAERSTITATDPIASRPLPCLMPLQRMVSRVCYMNLPLSLRAPFDVETAAGQARLEK
jgi:hypothetical protein